MARYNPKRGQPDNAGQFAKDTRGKNSPTSSPVSPQPTEATDNTVTNAGYTLTHEKWLEIRRALPLTESKSEKEALLADAHEVDEELLHEYRSYSVITIRWSNGKYTVGISHKHNSKYDISNDDVWDTYPDEEHYETIIEEQGWY
jgi:hypothetical protein